MDLGKFGLLGAALMAQNSPDFWSNLGRASLMSHSAGIEGEKQKRMQEEREALMKMRQQKWDQQQAQLQRQNELIGQFPEPYRSAFMANPALMQDYFKQQWERPDLPTGMVQGPNGPMYMPEYLKGQMALKRAGRAQTTINNNVGASLSPGQKKLDEKAAENLAGFESGGEFADSQKMISQLKEVWKALGESDSLTGPVIGNTPNAVLDVVNPQASDTREAVEEVVQRNLRLILGAQFTKEEGERLIARAYNPRLDESINRKRVGRLIAQMETAYEAKKAAAAHLRKHGTLRDFGGKLPTFQDFYDALDELDKEDKPETSGGWSIREK